MSPNILIVEDETIWSEQLKDILAVMKTKVQINVAQSHGEAKKYLTTFSYNLAIVDMCMNGDTFDLTCQQFFAFLNRNYPNTAVLAFTGKNGLNIDDGWTLSRLGVTEFVHKSQLNVPLFQKLIEDLLRTSIVRSNAHIFISYRRTDTQWPTQLIYNQLYSYFEKERVFRDIDDIGLGENFEQVIDQHVEGCYALLAIIGDKWLSITDSHGNRRLDDVNDYVRREVTTALKRNILTIPILVNDAQMPKSADLPDDLKKLSTLNALKVSFEHFNEDMDKLIQSLEDEFGKMGNI